MYTRRVHIRAWRKHVIFKNADYKRAAEARKQQQILRDMMADFEKMDKERAEAEAAAAEKAAADAHAKKAAEKRYRIYWSTRHGDGYSRYNTSRLSWRRSLNLLWRS